MLFGAGAKVPTPSVLNRSPLRSEEVPRLAKGGELKQLLGPLLIAWMLIPGPAGVRGLNFEFETTKGIGGND
jgi:hypothetical protein